jgi:uncharacterized cofD-like protein
MSATPLDISATVRGLDPQTPGATALVHGQVAVATTTGEILEVELQPQPPPACPQAVAAVQEADWLVFGPGSWFTSVLPHLLVPDLAAAVFASRARTCVVVNLDPQPGETAGFAPEAHLQVLRRHAPDLTVDVVIADEAGVGDLAALRAETRALGGELMLAPLRERPGVPRHSPRLLADAFRTAFSSASRG